MLSLMKSFGFIVLQIQITYFIINSSIQLGFKDKIKILEVKAITSSNYPVKARRPSNSSLNTVKLKKTFMIELPSWQEEANLVLQELIQFS